MLGSNDVLHFTHNDDDGTAGDGTYTDEDSIIAALKALIGDPNGYSTTATDIRLQWFT